MFFIGLGPNSHVPCNRASAPNPPCWIRANQAGFISVFNQLNVLVLWGVFSVFFFFSRVRKNRSSPLILQNSSEERRFLSATMSRSLLSLSDAGTPTLWHISGRRVGGRKTGRHLQPPHHSATPPLTSPLCHRPAGACQQKFAQVFLLCCRVQNVTAVHLELCPLTKCTAFQAAF